VIVAFSGWVAWTDAKFIRSTIDAMWGHHAMFGAAEVPLQVRVGDRADGLDAIVRNYIAGMDGTHLTVYTADVTALGKSAGAVCNKDMLLGNSLWDPSQDKPADLLVAFPRPDSPGPSLRSRTWNCIGQAHYRGVEVRIPAYAASAELLAVDEPLLLMAGMAQPASGGAG
jgi:hypothetical protein